MEETKKKRLKQGSNNICFNDNHDNEGKENQSKISENFTD